MAATTNKLGHRIGARGARTRQAILDAVRERLAHDGPAALRPADLAGAAGVSAPTFYTYFHNVDEAMLALCQAAAADFAGLAAHVLGEWSGDRAFVAARALVLETLDLWRTHGPVLRVERLMADAGAEAFAECRIHRLRRLHLALERRIAQAKGAGAHPAELNPRLASYEIASLIESVASGFDLMLRADTPTAVVDTTALIVVRLTTGR